MNRLFLLYCFLLASLFSTAQNSTIKVDEQVHDYGRVEQVYKLQSDFILKNEGSKNLFLMRADVSKNVKIRSVKKSIPPGDTALIEVYYYPQTEGKFLETINLVTSADALPFVLKIKGEIASIKQDDKTACYSFKRPGHNPVTNPGLIVMKNNTPKKDTAKKISYQEPIIPEIKDSLKPAEPVLVNEPEIKKETSLLDPEKYKPNNIIFLIDVSGSMREEQKLEMMKISMQKLLENLRENDRISLVTYRDTVKCLADSASGKDREKLEKLVAGLQASGITRGNTAILYSLDIALKNYLPEGNNQVILATDGKFNFWERDYKNWTTKVGDKNIVLSVIGIGKDREAMKTLKEISDKGKGSFIRITNEEKARSAVFDEIEKRSRK